MTEQRDTDRLIRAFLDEGRTELPDRAYDAVRAHIERTHQRVVIGPWRQPRMSNLARLALAAAAVLVVSVVGIRLLPGDPSLGGIPTETAKPTQTTSPTASPSPVPGPSALPDGALAPGTYVAHPLAPSNGGMAVTFTVPAGWEGFQGVGILPTTGAAGPGGMGIGLGGLVNGLYSDPCHGHERPDVIPGPTVDDLVQAFADQSAYETTAPVSVTFGGFSGKRLDLLLPSDVDFASCDNGGFYIWDGSIYAQGPGNRWHLSILDVEGMRVVILAQDFEATPAQDKAELQAILDSIRIEP
jgi:hypothetical protein